jgi:hypothetical protein
MDIVTGVYVTTFWSKNEHTFKTSRSNHRLLKTTLQLRPEKEHKAYVRRRARFPIITPPEQHNEADKILCKLAETVPRDPQKEKDDGRKNSWISEATWKLIDQKASARKNGNTTQAKEIGKQLRRSLKKDRQSRSDKVAEEIEACLVDDNVKEAYGKLQGWYKQRSGHVPKPTYKD